MSNPTCAICVTFTIKPEHVASFRDAVMQQAKNSLEKEPWCRQFDVCTSPERPHEFLLYETYDNAEAFHQKHRKTEHFDEFIKTIDDWVESKQFAIWEIQ